MTNTHHECFGRMLPDLSRMKANQPLTGPVFTVEYQSCGIEAQSHRVDTDVEGWDHCRACPEFDSCYALSLARFQVEGAAAEATGA